MDTALLTTVEQLSDDIPHGRADFAGLWPSESSLAAPIQPSAAPLSRSAVDLRDGQNGAMESMERLPDTGATFAPRVDAHPVHWRDPAQDRLIDWSATMGSNDSMPGVFTITDRKVRGGDDPYETPLYVLCRRWVRNDPEFDEASVPALQYLPDLLKLPDPLPLEEDDTAAPVEAPIQSASSAEPSTKVLMQRHMAHWLRVRQYHVKKINRKCDRYKQRLQILLNRNVEGSQQSAVSPSRSEHA